MPFLPRAEVAAVAGAFAFLPRFDLVWLGESPSSPGKNWIALEIIYKSIKKRPLHATFDS